MFISSKQEPGTNVLIATTTTLPEGTEATLIATAPHFHTDHPIELLLHKAQTTSTVFKITTCRKSTSHPPSHHIIPRTPTQCTHRSSLSLFPQKLPTARISSTILRPSSPHMARHLTTNSSGLRRSKLLQHQSTTHNFPHTPAAANTRRLQHNRITDHRHQLSNTQCNKISLPPPRPLNGRTKNWLTNVFVSVSLDMQHKQKWRRHDEHTRKRRDELLDDPPSPLA